MIQNGIKMYLLIVIMSYNLFAGSPDIDTKQLLRLFTRERFNVLAFDYCVQYSKHTCNQQDKERIAFFIKDTKTSLCGERALIEVQEFIDKQYKERGLWQCVNMLQGSIYQQEIGHIIDKYLDCDKPHKKVQ